MYKHDGTLLTDDNNKNQGNIVGDTPFISYTEADEGTTVTCEIAAHATGIICAKSGLSGIYGYGSIEWYQEGNVTQAVVANGTIINSDLKLSYTLPVNGGMPF